MSKVTILSKPNRIVIASKGVQGPPGPEGPASTVPGPDAYEVAVAEGFVGTRAEWLASLKGDTGDVTPEALAARDAAEAARDAAVPAAAAAVAARAAAQGSADDAADSAAAAEASRLLGPPVGYATLADRPAPGTANRLVVVTNDPNPDNNGTYRDTGSAWVKSADRVTGLEGRVGAVEADVASTGMSYPNPIAINLDLAAGLLRITASQVRVFYGRKSFLLAGQDVALPATRQRVIANTSTGAVSFTSATTIPSGSVVLGSYDHISKELVGFPPHFVNGAAITERGFARAVVSSASAIQFDVGDRKLVLSNARIVSPEYATTITATIPFPANSAAIYKLEFVPGTSPQVRFTPASSASVPNDKPLVFGWVRIQAGRVDVFGIDEYVVTGGDGNPLDVYEGVLVGTRSAEYINFDWANGFLRITASSQVRCLYGRANPYVPAQDLALSGFTFITAWHKVLYDVDTGLLSWLPVNNAFQPANTIVVGMFKPDTKEVRGFPAYYVNGQPSTSGASNLESLEWLLVDGPTEPQFTVPALLSDFKAFGGSGNTDYNTIYALYDALVSTYPDYVIRTLLGNDDAANPIYRYDFKPPADNGMGSTGRLAKMILVSSAHGYERAGIYCLYSALHQIASRWQEDDLLDTLRWNCHFIVVPCLVPYGFNAVDRFNPNGVDIARNFTAEWSSSQANPGPSPLSEKESQYLDAVMAANRDAIYCGSFHNFLDSSSGDPNFIWNASATMFGVRLAQRLVSKMSRKWKATYPWLPQNNTTLFGYSNPSAPPGSEGKQSTIAYGIQGGTFEISRALHAAPDPDSYSQYVNTLGTETIVNWLLMNLEHGTQLYNGRGS